MKPAPQPIILAAIDRMRVLRRERPVAVEARAERGTILALRFTVTRIEAELEGPLGPSMPVGIRLVEDPDVPPRRVRYYDRRGRMVSEVAC